MTSSCSKCTSDTEAGGSWPLARKPQYSAASVAMCCRLLTTAPATTARCQGGRSLRTSLAMRESSQPVWMSLVRKSLHCGGGAGQGGAGGELVI
jgi:hypothetical protein